MAGKTDDRPIYLFGAKIPSRTASFYKALGVPLEPQKPGVTQHFIGDLGDRLMHIVPSPAPPGILGIAFATLVPSIHIAVTRLCTDGHVAAADGIDIREMPVEKSKTKTRSVTKPKTPTYFTRHAILKDPDNRTVLLVETQELPEIKPPTH